MRYRKLTARSSLPLMRALTMNPLGQVAVPAKNLKAGRILISPQPSQNLDRAADLATMSGTVTCDVVNLKKLYVAFTAASASRALATVGKNRGGSELVAIAFRLCQLGGSVSPILRLHVLQRTRPLFRIGISKPVKVAAALFAIR